MLKLQLKKVYFCTHSPGEGVISYPLSRRGCVKRVQCPLTSVVILMVYLGALHWYLQNFSYHCFPDWEYRKVFTSSHGDEKQ